MYQKAFRYFQEGELQRALKVLSEANLSKQSEAILKEREKISEINKEIEVRDSIQKNRSAEIIKALSLKADLHKTSYEYDSVKVVYDLLVQLDSTNYKILWGLASFYKDQNQTKESIKVYEKALKYVNSEEEKAYMLNELGAEFSWLKNFERARDCHVESFIIRRKLNEKDSIRYAPDLAQSLTHLATFHSMFNQYELAEKAFVALFDLLGPMVKESPRELLVSELARSYINYALLCKGMRKLKKAEESLLIAHDLFGALVKDFPSKYKEYEAYVLHNLGLIYIEQKLYKQAEESYFAAFELRKQLLKINPEKYEPTIFSSLYSIGAFYGEIKLYKEAESFLLQALDLGNELSQKVPGRYDGKIAMIYHNLGICYLSSDLFEKAKEYFITSLELKQNNISNFLENNHTSDWAANQLVGLTAEHESGLADTQYLLGVTYSNLNDSINADTFYHSALTYYNRLANRSPGYFSVRAAETNTSIAVFYSYLNNHTKAQNYFISALSFYKELITNGESQFLLQRAKLLPYLGLSYYKTEDYKDAEEAYLESEKTYGKLRILGKTNLDSDLALNLHEIGSFYFNIGDYSKSLSYLDRSLIYLNEIATDSPKLYELKIARVLLSKVKIMLQINELDKANELLEGVKKIAANYPNFPYSQELIYFSNQLYLSQSGVKTMSYEFLRVLREANPYISKRDSLSKEIEKIAPQLKVIEIFRQALSLNLNDKEIRSYLARSYGNLSWLQLCTHKFNSAEESARKGLDIDPNQKWIITNLAASLLFQGKFKSAKTVYIEWKDQLYDEHKEFKIVFLQDIEDLRKKGINHQDTNRIQKILNK